jgi:SAM-dependent methyltransferase
VIISGTTNNVKGVKMASMEYASPVHVTDVNQCDFYHTIDLPTIGEIKGQWDLRKNIVTYLGGLDFKGKTCLDVGTASGYLTFEMEKRGGIVTSFDADDASRYHFLPFRNSLYTTNHELWARQTNEWLGRLHNSYWLCHRLLKSMAKVFYGDVYALPIELGPFDVVMVGQIMIHLRDPILALTSIAGLCADTLIIAEGMLDTDDTIAKFHARASTGGPEWLWWQYSRGMWREILAILGFEVTAMLTDRYTCLHEYNIGESDITTIVARRESVQ